jgi:flagellar hook assembly protein FlgD
VINPQPIRSKADARFRLSIPATVSVHVMDARGAVVRTLIETRELGAGEAAFAWDRKDDAGRRVKAGTYVLHVEAFTSGGLADEASATFAAS